MTIAYSDSLEAVTVEKLHGFFDGWKRQVSRQEHLLILANSYAFILAVDDTTDTVVGFVTAISDGVLCAYIPLLEVLPEYRNHGIGSELIRRLLAKLDGIYMIDLMCDENMRIYYERLGFFPCHGMAIRNSG